MSEAEKFSTYQNFSLLMEHVRGRERERERERERVWQTQTTSLTTASNRTASENGEF